MGYERAHISIGVAGLHIQGAHLAHTCLIVYTLALPFGEVILARVSFSIRRFVSVAMAKPKCYFDITIGGQPAGRIVFEVSAVSFDYRAYDSCIHTARFFPRQVFALFLFAYVLHLYLQLILFCYLQLRGDVVPKTAGLYKSCSA